LLLYQFIFVETNQKKNTFSLILAYWSLSSLR